VGLRCSPGSRRPTTQTSPAGEGEVVRPTVSGSGSRSSKAVGPRLARAGVEDGTTRTESMKQKFLQSLGTLRRKDSRRTSRYTPVRETGTSPASPARAPSRTASGASELREETRPSSTRTRRKDSLRDEQVEFWGGADGTGERLQRFESIFSSHQVRPCRDHRGPAAPAAVTGGGAAGAAAVARRGRRPSAFRPPAARARSCRIPRPLKYPHLDADGRP